MDQMKSFGLNYELIYGVDGREDDVISYSDSINQDYFIEKYKRKMKPTEVACTLSHRKMLQSFVYSSESYAVFLEDDALFVENPKEVLDELAKLNLDMVVLGYPSRTYFEGKYSKVIEPVYSNINFFGNYVVGLSPQKKNFGLMAYCLSKSAAIKLLEDDKVFSVADDYELICSKVDVYHARPYLCIERRNVVSSINNTYRSSNGLSMVRRLSSRLVRGGIIYLVLGFLVKLGFKFGYK